MKLSQTHVIIVKTLIHIAQIFSLVWLYFAVVNEYWGADPVQQIIHFTGKATIHTLIITLLVSPVAQWFKLGLLCKTRRLLGVYTFVWAALHLASYAWFDLALEWKLLASEIISRPYLVVGAFAWLILAALTLTSLQSMQKKMGRNWQVLHNWVYLAVIAGAVHYIWSVKSLTIEPVLYLAGVALLLWLRKDKIKRWLKQGILPKKEWQPKKRSKAGDTGVKKVKQHMFEPHS